MAALAKMNANQWTAVRHRWEADPREGFAWLIGEMHLPVSREALRQRAKKEGWAKQQASGDGGKLGGTLQALRQAVMDGVSGRDAELTANAGPALAGVPEIADQLSPQQRAFVEFYAMHGNATKAAVAAGYSIKTATQQGSRLLRNVYIAQAVEVLRDARLRRLSSEADEVLRFWANIATASPAELTRYERKGCPWCWGEDGRPQYTPEDYDYHLFKHLRTQKQIIELGGEDIGDFPAVRGDWRDPNRDPHPDCPNCGGLGVGRMVIADTDCLSPAARLLFDGVEQTRDGLKVRMLGRERAVENLARVMGMFDTDKRDDDGGEMDTAELDETYSRIMAQSRERQRRVDESRRAWINGETDELPDDEAFEV